MTETDATFARRFKGDLQGVRERHECPPNVDICDGGDACWDICLAHGRWITEAVDAE